MVQSSIKLVKIDTTALSHKAKNELDFWFPKESTFGEYKWSPVINMFTGRSGTRGTLTMQTHESAATGDNEK